MKNYYKILDIPQTATEDEVKKAYRMLAKKYHPDANPNNAEAAGMFSDINEAHTILSDAQARKVYDERLASTAQTRKHRTTNANGGANYGGVDTNAYAKASAQEFAGVPTELEARVNAYITARVGAALNAVSVRAFKDGYARGAAAANASVKKATEQAKKYAEDSAKARARMEAIERDRRELEAELFGRDRELTLERMRVEELESQLASERADVNPDGRVERRNAELVKLLEQAQAQARAAEMEKSKLQAAVNSIKSENAMLLAQVEELTARMSADDDTAQAVTEQEIAAYLKKQKSDIMKSVPTLFGALGHTVWATDEQLRDALGKLTALYKNGEHGIAARAQTAYAVLSDPKKRAEYIQKLGLTEARIASERVAAVRHEHVASAYRSRLDEEFWKVYDEMLMLAMAGDPEVQNEIGEMYYAGDEVERDVDYAVFWFKMAVNHKLPDAMYNIGVCYVNGEGVDKNQSVGLSFIRQAQLR